MHSSTLVDQRQRLAWLDGLITNAVMLVLMTGLIQHASRPRPSPSQPDHSHTRPAPTPASLLPAAVNEQGPCPTNCHLKEIKLTTHDIICTYVIIALFIVKPARRLCWWLNYVTGPPAGNNNVRLSCSEATSMTTNSKHDKRSEAHVYLQEPSWWSCPTPLVRESREWRPQSCGARGGWGYTVASIDLLPPRLAENGTSL